MSQTIIEFCNGLPPEVMWIAMLLLCYGTVLVMLRFFGIMGLYAYIAASIIGANIQVLKIVQFSFFSEPIALGTIWFSSIYLAADVITEREGTAKARKALYLGFAVYLFFTLAMLVTSGFSPPTPPNDGGDYWGYDSHGHIVALFSPMPQIFLAGMAAYMVSGLADVWIFQRLRDRFSGKHLWLRNNVSTMIAAVIDSTVFSFLAWVILASEPLPIRTVIVTYIGGSLAIRFCVAFLDTPFMYLAKRIHAPS